MIGRVDEKNRALLPIQIRAELKGETTTIEAWIDTPFDGHFVFSAMLIEDLALETLVETEAILADGNKVTLENYLAYLNWFDETIPVEVIANDGQLPLLGTALIVDCQLTINYVSKSVEIVSVG